MKPPTNTAPTPYSGTIATTEGVQLSPLATREPTPEHQIDQQALTNRLHQLSKWGPCEAIPILQVRPIQTEALPGFIPAHLSVRSRDIHDGKAYQAIDTAMNEHARKQIRQHHAITTLDRPPELGAANPTVHDLPGPAGDYRATVFAWNFSGNPKATTRATKGAAQTRYFILHDSDRALPRWEDGHPTQAEARKHLPSTLAHHHGIRDQNYSIIAMTRRHDGRPLVEHNLDPTARPFTKVYARAHLERIIAPTQVTDHKGWLFYGMAAS